MATGGTRKIPSWLFWGGLLIGGVILLYFVPLFHVVPLDQSNASTGDEPFDASEEIETFWREQLPAVIAGAVAVEQLQAARREDPSAAADRFGHRLGLGGRACYLVSGIGEVQNLTARSVEIQTAGGDRVVIGLGPVFGNTIREASGVFDVNEFANSQEFNALSTELNQRIEDRVLSSLREESEVGRRIRFVGGVEISDTDAIGKPLKLVPLSIDFL